MSKTGDTKEEIGLRGSREKKIGFRAMGRFFWEEKASEIGLLLHRALNWLRVIFGLLGLTQILQLLKGTYASVKPEAEEKCEAKKSFLEKFGDVYGYPGTAFPIDKLRATEFARLNGMGFLIL